MAQGVALVHAIEARPGLWRERADVETMYIPPGHGAELRFTLESPTHIVRLIPTAPQSTRYPVPSGLVKDIPIYLGTHHTVTVVVGWLDHRACSRCGPAKKTAAGETTRPLDTLGSILEQQHSCWASTTADGIAGAELRLEH